MQILSYTALTSKHFVLSGSPTARAVHTLSRWGSHGADRPSSGAEEEAAREYNMH